MSVSYWNEQSNKKCQNFDITIIGGGISGISCAYWLHKEDPKLKIALIEKYQIAAGATGRNAGFITCGSVEHFNRLVAHHGTDKALAIWNFSEKNLKLLKQEVIAKGNQDLDFGQVGSFSLASEQNEFDELKKSFELMRENKINVEILDQKSVYTRLGAKHFVGGIKYCDDANIHPRKLVSYMLNILENSANFKLFENHEVYKIETQAQQKLLKTNKSNFLSELVILATNAYSKLIHPYFEDKILPTRGQILCTSKVEQFMEGPCYANFVLDYFRQLPSGELIIGGFRQLQKDTEVGFSDEISPLIQKALEDFLHKHLPRVSDAKITHRWSGVMGFSADGNPLIGSLPDDNQTFFLGGFTAHGLGLSFHTAKCLADLIYGRNIPEFLSAKRFN